MATRGGLARAALAMNALLLLAACGGAHPPEAARPAAGEQAFLAPTETGAAAGLSNVAPAAGRPPELVGLSREQVASLLGAPTLLRREAPAEVWQYVGAACVLHVFLYQEHGAVRVAHYESAVRGGRRVKARDCYDRLFDETARRGDES